MKIAKTLIYLELTNKTLPVYTDLSFDDVFNQLQDKSDPDIILSVAFTSRNSLWYPTCNEEPHWRTALYNKNCIRNFSEAVEPKVNIDYGELS